MSLLPCQPIIHYAISLHSPRQCFHITAETHHIQNKRKTKEVICRVQNAAWPSGDSDWRIGDPPPPPSELYYVACLVWVTAGESQNMTSSDNIGQAALCTLYMIYIYTYPPLIPYVMCFCCNDSQKWNSLRYSLHAQSNSIKTNHLKLFVSLRERLKIKLSYWLNILTYKFSYIICI